MKIPHEAVIRVFSGLVIISDLLFSSFLFFCGAVFFVFEGVISSYSFLAGIVVLTIAIGYFYILGVLAKRMKIIDDLLDDEASKKFCFFCWILRSRVQK